MLQGDNSGIMQRSQVKRKFKAYEYPGDIAFVDELPLKQGK